MSGIEGLSNQRKHIVYLLTISPVNGIAFYESSAGLHVLDVVAAQDLTVATDVASYISTLTGTQMNVGKYFRSKTDLIAYVKREYLRDKKNSFYSELFTRALEEKSQIQILEFLNQDRLSCIPFSKELIPIIKRLMDPDLGERVPKLAAELKLTNVLRCLETELAQLTAVGCSKETRSR